jgi:uncharacterized protein
VRRALRTGGEPIRQAWLTPSRQPRRLVPLFDVSGSMDAYTQGLLRFSQAAVVGRRRVETFALGTRRTRLTHELSSRDPDCAMRRASVAVADWSGVPDSAKRCGPTTTLGACGACHRRRRHPV